MLDNSVISSTRCEGISGCLLMPTHEGRGRPLVGKSARGKGGREGRTALKASQGFVDLGGRQPPEGSGRDIFEALPGGCASTLLRHFQSYPPEDLLSVSQGGSTSPGLEFLFCARGHMCADTRALFF